MIECDSKKKKQCIILHMKTFIIGINHMYDHVILTECGENSE